MNKRPVLNRFLEPFIMAVERQLARTAHVGDASRADDALLVAPAIRTAIETIRFAHHPEHGEPYRAEVFGTGAPQQPQGPLWPGYDAACVAFAAASAPHRKQLADLLVALDALQRRLLFEADCAEYTDARNNSRQYLYAAGYLDRAAMALIALALAP